MTVLPATTAYDHSMPITEASSRAEIEEALAHCSASAGRCLQRDNLNRVNAEWTAVHRYLDYLLTLWQRVGQPLDLG